MRVINKTVNKQQNTKHKKLFLLETLVLESQTYCLVLLVMNSILNQSLQLVLNLQQEASKWTQKLSRHKFGTQLDRRDTEQSQARNYLILLFEIWKGR